MDTSVMDDSMLDTSIIPSDPIAAQLDTEIASLQSQITALKNQRTHLTSTLLSSQTSKTILSRLRASRVPTTTQKTLAQITSDPSPLVSLFTTQQSHNRENLYRICAGVTTFRVQDPDPNAVDGGKVLGIRWDISTGGKFRRPYYVFLVQVEEKEGTEGKGRNALRVHRHTLPPCIPLSSLVDKHLPLPSPSTSSKMVKPKSTRQDLQHFVKEVRRGIVGYHNRTHTISSLRKEFHLDSPPDRKGKRREKVIVDISAADAEAKQVRIEWRDGRIGRVVVGEGGEVRKCVVIGEDGRDREVERRVVGPEGNKDMVGIGERLREGIY